MVVIVVAIGNPYLIAVSVGCGVWGVGCGVWGVCVVWGVWGGWWGCGCNWYTSKYKFHELERGYRDCIRTRDKTRIYCIPHDAPGA